VNSDEQRSPRSLMLCVCLYLERELDREMPKLFAGDGRYGRICSRFYVLVHALTLVSETSVKPIVIAKVPCCADPRTRGIPVNSHRWTICSFTRYIRYNMSSEGFFSALGATNEVLPRSSTSPWAAEGHRRRSWSSRSLARHRGSWPSWRSRIDCQRGCLPWRPVGIVRILRVLRRQWRIVKGRVRGWIYVVSRGRCGSRNVEDWVNDRSILLRLWIGR
jgi:hypothetical protein